MRKPGFTIDKRTGAKIYGNPVATSYSSALQPGTEAYKTAFGNLGTKEKILQGARDFARAPLDNPISIGSASTIGVQAAPKLGYNEVERLNRELARKCCRDSDKSQGLSYEESMRLCTSTISLVLTQMLAKQTTMHLWTIIIVI
jgi:hypothetical protein